MSLLREYSNCALESVLSVRRGHAVVRNKSAPAVKERKVDSVKMPLQGRVFRQGEQKGSVEMRQGDIFQFAPCDAAKPTQVVGLQNRAQNGVSDSTPLAHEFAKLNSTPLRVQSAAQFSSGESSSRNAPLRTSAEGGNTPPPARKVCSCGTSVLFPGPLATRTCWNCNTVHHRDETTAPSRQTQPQIEVESDMVRRPACLEQASASVHGEQQKIGLEAETLVSQSRSAFHCGLQTWSLLALLVVSLALNAAGIAARFGGGGTNLPVEFTGHTLDTDGDGILDHHDFCPHPCTSKNGTCSDVGWRSGPATDFDGDGCQDGVEDLDKDGDGVWDIKDRCPFTSQTYKFVSNLLSDFDADGCADGIEDTDDDGDEVVNTFDRCPHTQPGNLVDETGCSEMQRREGPKEQVVQNFVHVANAVPKEQVMPESLLDQWISLFKSAWVEVILGAILTELMQQAHGFATSIPAVSSNQASTFPNTHRPASTGGLWRNAWLRALVYGVFFCAVYYARLGQN